MKWPEFSYAFQPIVDAEAHAICSYEALIRGPDNEPAMRVFDQIAPADRHRFDEHTRQIAIAEAVGHDLRCNLNLNCLPRSVIGGDGPFRTTLEAAERHGLPIDRLILEVTEEEIIDDQQQFARVMNRFRGLGMRVAIDDFGAGYAGLNLLADFQPDMVKIDMKLVRGIESHGPRQAIVRALLQACGDLGIDLIAEGVETASEYFWFRDQGVRFFQGYFLARPAFQRLAGFLDPERGAAA